MATQVSLFRSSGSLYVSRQAAIRQAVKDAFDGYDPADATVDPATLVAAAAIDTQGTEVLGTVDPDNPAHRFHLIAVHVPDDWAPEHELSVPEFGWLGEYQRDRDGHDTRQDAFRRLAELNDLGGPDPLFPETRFWFVAVQEGDPIPDETVDSFVFERDRGILTRFQSMPLVLVLPTAEEVRDGLAHLVDYRAQEAAENAAHGKQTPTSEPAEDAGEESGPRAEAKEAGKCGTVPHLPEESVGEFPQLGNNYPVEETNGHASGNNYQKQAAKRPTLEEVLWRVGFEMEEGGYWDAKADGGRGAYMVAFKGPQEWHAIAREVTPAGLIKALADQLGDVEYELSLAAEIVSDGEPQEVSPMGEKTDGRVSGGNSCHPKTAKRPTLAQVLQADGFDNFGSATWDDGLQELELMFSPCGVWYVPATGYVTTPEGILLALATDLEATAAKFRKAAAEGLARPGAEDDEGPDEDEDTEVEEKEEAGEPMAVVGGVA